MSDTTGKRGVPAPNPVRARVAVMLAAVLIVLALAVPGVVSRPTPSVVWSLPLEAMLAAALVVIVPGRARRGVAVVLGLLLGVSTVLRLIDLGFFAALARPFDLLFDWSLFGNGFEFLRGAFGRAGAVATLVSAVLIAVVLLLALTWSAVRLSRLADDHRVGLTRFLAVGVAGFVAYQFLVTQILSGLPPTGATVAYDRALTVRASLADRQAFAAQLEVDAFADTPGAELLTGLRGKDVVLAFVESYGRDAVEDPLLAAPDRRNCSTDGDRRLACRRVRGPQRLPDLVDVRR